MGHVLTAQHLAAPFELLENTIIGLVQVWDTNSLGACPYAVECIQAGHTHY